MVMATQNPIEYEGTYPLPEAQLDRFTMRIAIGYPPLSEEAKMLTEQTAEPPLDALEPVANAADAVALADEAKAIFVEESLNRYVVALLRATRSDSRLYLGASPRAGIAILRVAKARALGDGRSFLEPDDIKAVAVPVLAHRLILAPEARSTGLNGEQIVRETLDKTPSPGLMLTRRGRVIFALGFGVYVAAWAFGSKPLYPVATGLLLVVGVAWVWVRLSDRPFRVKRGWGDHEHVEGDNVPIVAELHPTGNVLPASVTLSERVGRLGEQRHVLRRNGRRLSVRYVLENVPRGRYAFEDVRAELSDPFALERAIVPLPAPGALLVYPRLVHLGPLFSESGTRSHDGQRLLLRRHSGIELHSVREYAQGESLRRVHWPSTARRGQLMVKELEDSPRDEIAVLLDADPKAVVGESFEVQVRAAGSLLDAYVQRGRRGVLVLNSERREVQHVHSPAADWRRALELLAAVEPTGDTSVARLLAEEDGPAARALELVVVTARLEPALVDRLIQRALSRRKVSVVFVDPASFNGTPRRPEPALLRLQAAGIAVAVIRAGDDLATCLSPEPATGSAHA